MDLSRADVDMHIDLTAGIPFADGEFDLVICSHVLEHIDDDAAAIRELHRVTAPGGECLIQVPYQSGRPCTYEDPTIVTAAGRLEAFDHPEHVRIYGRDIRDRLQAGGFTVDSHEVADRLSGPERSRFGIPVRTPIEYNGETVWVCKNPG